MAMPTSATITTTTRLISTRFNQTFIYGLKNHGRAPVRLTAIRRMLTQVAHGVQASRAAGGIGLTKRKGWHTCRHFITMPTDEIGQMPDGGESARPDRRLSYSHPLKQLTRRHI